MIPRSRYILINAYHILIDGLFDSVPVLLTFMVLTFNSNEAAVGLIVSIGTAAGTATGLLTLVFSATLGFFGATSLVTALYGIGFLGAAFSGNIFVAGACFTLAIAGHTVFHNIAFSYITLHTERQRLGRIMSDFTAIGDVGRIPLVTLAAFAAAYTIWGHEGWRVVCLAYGAVTLALAAWLFITSSKDGRQKKPEGNRLFPSFSLLRQKDVFLSMLGSVLNACSNDRIFTFLPLLLLAKGIDPKIIGSFALGFTVGSFLGKMACGRLVDAFGSRNVFISAEFLLTGLLVALIWAENIWFIVILALALGIVTKGTVPVIQAIITGPVPNGGAYDDVFSINSLARGITNMGTPLLFGLMASMWGMSMVYAFMALIAAIAAIPVWMMSRP
ncbi:MAG: MFS transporter [Desulfovibrio sp.]|jgi:predicted MFS family arabinose efflux permease|nr:MFS transporter [Desulfovibrio sp.]